MSHGATIVSGAGITLDRDNRLVTVCDRPVNLTRSEYAILEALMERPRIATHAQLIEAMYENARRDEPEGPVEVLRVIIAGLRRKLAKAGQSDVIRNVHGVGYSFAAWGYGRVHWLAQRRQAAA